VPRIRRGSSPDLRETILAATSLLLADRSFGDLAVSDILSAAGVSRGTFYFYFDSKQAVYASSSSALSAKVTPPGSPGWPIPLTPSPRCEPDVSGVPGIVVHVPIVRNPSRQVG